MQGQRYMISKRHWMSKVYFFLLAVQHTLEGNGPVAKKPTRLSALHQILHRVYRNRP